MNPYSVPLQQFADRIPKAEPVRARGARPHGKPPWDLVVVGRLARWVLAVPVQVVGVAVACFLWFHGYDLVTLIIVAPCSAMVFGWAKQAAKFAAGYYPKARAFAIAHACGFAGAEIAGRRNATCGVCESRDERNGKLFCGQCGCGHHPIAALSWKNRLAGHACPIGKFPGFVDVSFVCKCVIAGCWLLMMAALWMIGA